MTATRLCCAHGPSSCVNSALAAARAALTLDPECGEAHAMVGYLLTLQSWSRLSARPLPETGARRSLREALKRGPDTASALLGHIRRCRERIRAPRSR